MLTNYKKSITFSLQRLEWITKWELELRVHTRNLPHMWRVVWGCARSPWGVTAAGRAEGWPCSRSRRYHRRSAAWKACYAWCGGRVEGGQGSRRCGPRGRSAAVQTTVWCRHYRRRAHSAGPERTDRLIRQEVTWTQYALLANWRAFFRPFAMCSCFMLK